jgi:hypothetical protein
MGVRTVCYQKNQYVTLRVALFGVPQFLFSWTNFFKTWAGLC